MGRCLTGEAVYREAEILTDICGGIPATFPYEGDWVNPETKDFLEKYVMRNPKISAKNAAQFWRYMGDILCSATGGIANVGNYHGGGSPVMEQIAINSSMISRSENSSSETLQGLQKTKKLKNHINCDFGGIFDD